MKLVHIRKILYWKNILSTVQNAIFHQADEVFKQSYG